MRRAGHLPPKKQKEKSVKIKNPKLKKTPGTKKKFPIGTDVEKKYIGQENPLFPIPHNYMVHS